MNHLGDDYRQYLITKIEEDNQRPLLPDLPRPDMELVAIPMKKVKIDGILNPPEFVGDPILGFAPPYAYAWLHNDYPCELSAMGYKFRSVTEAFEATKIEIMPNDPDWEINQFNIMRMLVEQKFTRDDNFKFMLLGTRKKFIEFVNETDGFWGTKIGEPLHAMVSEITGLKYNGRNELGQILMNTRKNIPSDMTDNAVVFR
jgi:hypothetical protein